jgi:ribosomal-protein-alanine N-acetyltransferase
MNKNNIITNKYILKKLTKKDFFEIKKLYLNESVRKFLGGICNEYEFEVKFNNMLKWYEKNYCWTINDKFLNYFIGIVCLELHHNEIDMELSYQLLPNFWRQGVATEVLEKIILFSFNTLKLPLILAETQKANHPSCKLLEKLNFEVSQEIIRFGEKQKIYKLINYSLQTKQN